MICEAKHMHQHSAGSMPAFCRACKDYILAQAKARA